MKHSLEFGQFLALCVRNSFALLAHSQLCDALLALRMCELLVLVMLPLQELSSHVATLPGSAALAFLNVAFFEKSHMQYRKAMYSRTFTPPEDETLLGSRFLALHSLIKDTCSTL